MEPSKHPEITIYWDAQDSNNEGPAWRTDTESGSLEFVQWNDPDDAEGYNVREYFGQNGEYKGPDCYGIHPIFEAV